MKSPVYGYTNILATQQTPKPEDGLRGKSNVRENSYEDCYSIDPKYTYSIWQSLKLGSAMGDSGTISKQPAWAASCASSAGRRCRRTVLSVRASDAAAICTSRRRRNCATNVCGGSSSTSRSNNKRWSLVAIHQMTFIREFAWTISKSTL